MWCCRWGAALVFATLASPGWSGDGKAADKPRLDVRVTPRVALPPVEVLVVADLVGGEDVEELYCPGLEWDWGDGTRSFHESDCPPYEPGAEVDRFYSARHAYFEPGRYSVRVRLWRAGRYVMAAETSLLVGGAAVASGWD